MRESDYNIGEKGAWTGIISNLLLFVIKLAAGIVGRSQAMVADAVHTASDAVTSVGVIIGFKIARKPADEHHPFGHARAESIVAKLVSIVLIVVGLGIAYDSARTLLAGDISKPGSIALFADRRFGLDLHLKSPDIFQRCLRIPQNKTVCFL